MKIGKLHKDAFKIMKRFHSLDHSMGPLIIVSAFVAGLVPFISIAFSAPILNELINKQYKVAFKYSIIMAVMTCVFGILSEYINKLVNARSTALSMKIESMIHEKPLKLDYASVEDGNVIKDFTSAFMALRYKGNYATLLKDYAKLLQNIISFIFAMTLTLKLCISDGKSNYTWLNTITSPLFSIMFILIIIILISGVMGKVVKWAQNKISELFEVKLDSEKRFAYLARMIRDEDMVKMVQSYDAEDLVADTFNKTSKLIRKNYKRECTFWNISSVVQAFSSALITVLSYGVVTLKVLANAISLSSFLKYSQAIIKMNEAILNMVSVNEDISEIMVYMNKLMEFLDLENKFETGSIPIEKRSDHEYKFCFEHVWFKYQCKNDYVLKDVSCELNLHEKVGLIGPNGAGKSTFIKLLCRLYEPTKGRITLNGVDIRKYNYEEYLSLFSVVFQDFGLFSFSLGENVASSIDYDQNKVKRCLNKSGLNHFEDKIYENINEVTMISAIGSSGKSEKFSGGEKQKIAIARALYKDAALVILDEPTAALDPLSEYDIYQRFDLLVGDKTCVYISHRMSSCRFCSDIIVLHMGEIVERGNHESLLKEGKLYSEMWNAQAKYYTAN
ncbi:ABC transporter ATP-binding protein [Clostridium algidicarnis]|uniref:ABC transporter ATP-binding protein n=1 Tax=Clostridium algidicarnis TaxID=37659 RepID=UPI001C0AF125|nr:ABC transporter ATP-binding protein [Clostridium algidicarnis]MBU3227067.1 ABC transporter ATP-binding protein/permease [Clostridium algidicarnis]MBU3250592.1 ABC transporter ATP-binding protein/permease [Clostridium algidicarnis]